MTLDYYYGDQAEQFSFYRIPKLLFTDKRFKDLSAEAKILYGLLLDRMSLSAKNGWLDQEGRVYIVYTVEDIMDALSCASQKAMKLLNELDEKRGLTGVLIQGKETTPSYKVRKRVTKPENEWAVVPDTHEAIIERRDFDSVQKALSLDTRRSPGDSAVQLFSGMVFCGECGASRCAKLSPPAIKNMSTMSVRRTSRINPVLPTGCVTRHLQISCWKRSGSISWMW